MRVTPRWLVTLSVLGSLAASGTTVLVMPQRTEPADGVVELPSFAPDPPGAPGQEVAPDPQLPAASGPPVTGRQIVELAAGPAARRAEDLAAQAEPSPNATPPTAASTTAAPAAGDETAEELRKRIREACEEGTLKGKVCRNR